MIAPSKIAPLVVWLCTDAAAGVNGRTFLVFGDRVSLLTEPRPKTTIEQAGGWTLDDLDRVGTRAARRRFHQPLDPRRPPRTAGISRRRTLIWARWPP